MDTLFFVVVLDIFFDVFYILVHFRKLVDIVIVYHDENEDKDNWPDRHFSKDIYKTREI
jgi:hypothetical protein